MKRFYNAKSVSKTDDTDKKHSISGRSPLLIISGPTLAEDKALHRDLQKIATVLVNKQNSNVETILDSRKVDLLLLEIDLAKPAEVEIIKRVKMQHPRLSIILIDGDHDVLIKAFAYGAKDGFRKPYERKLVVERIQAILKYLQK
jgi:DNA-binding response OmpR family regulator